MSTDPQDELRLLSELEFDQEHSPRRDRIFAEIEAGRDKLHPIEWDLFLSLKRKPVAEWCIGCFRMIDALHRKACSDKPSSSE